MNLPKKMKGESAFEVLYGLASLVFIIWLIYFFVGSGLGEREGRVNYSDCRETIPLAEDNFHKFYQGFTCEYYKTEKGKIINGTCVHIDYDGNSGCKVAYIYNRGQDKNQCTDKKFPVLGINDMCYPKN
jgi:hypothetical protein